MSPRPADSIEPGSLEALRAENQALRVENQILKDEIARLKGLPSRPPSKPHRPSGMEKATDPSGSKNRTGRRKARGAKRDSDRVTREVIVKAEVPAGSRFKGYETLPPIIFPGRPERWWGEEALKAEADTPQATLEQRHQAAGHVLPLRRRGFFSTGVLFSIASHMRVETAQ